MNPIHKSAFFAAGGGLSREAGSNNAPSPVEVAAERRVKFPAMPPPGPSWQAFMAFTPAQVAAYAEITGQVEVGAMPRQYLFDAWSSLFPWSWRYDGAVNQERDFLTKFAESMRHARNYGPRAESPNDPPPALNADSPTAAFFLTLPPAAADRLRLEIIQQSPGRIVRCQLKRAFELATDAASVAMQAAWKNELALFAEEWVWADEAQRTRAIAAARAGKA